MAITFVSDENDAKILNDVQDRFDVNVSELPAEIEVGTYSEYSIIIFLEPISNFNTDLIEELQLPSSREYFWLYGNTERLTISGVIIDFRLGHFQIKTYYFSRRSRKLKCRVDERFQLCWETLVVIIQ